ncbi:MAG TPA: HD-GYP domain-containing protein [Bacillota bacterium]|nr:HD-GYP domain-containing protein [Bacillota bacterium]
MPLTVSSTLPSLGLSWGISYPLSNLFKGGIDPLRYLFNSAQTLVSAIVAGLAFKSLGGTVGGSFTSQLIPVLIAGLVYFLINTFSVIFIIAMQQKTGFWGIWLSNLKSVLPNLLTLAPMGFLLGSIYSHLGWLAICIYIAPLWLARHSFKQYTDMREMFLNTMKALSLSIDAKDNYTSGHSVRVAEFSVAIAKQLKLSDANVENLRYVALLHDIGKISVPEHVLNKPGRLTEEEFDRVKEHTVVGANIVREVEHLGNAYLAIRHHHERYDGKGYPDGLSGEDIPIEARIIAVADTFDAMTSDRVYRKGLSHEVALKELRQVAGTQLDARVVEGFLAAYSGQCECIMGERFTFETETR